MFGWEEHESSQVFGTQTVTQAHLLNKFTLSHLPCKVNHSSCMYVMRSAPMQDCIYRDCELSSLRFYCENILPNHVVDKSRSPGCAPVKSKREENDLAEALCAYWHHIGHYSGGNLFQGQFPPYAPQSTSDSDLVPLVECHDWTNNSSSYHRRFMWHATSSKHTLFLWSCFITIQLIFLGKRKFFISSHWVLELQNCKCGI